MVGLSVFQQQGESWAWRHLDPQTGSLREIATLPWPQPPWPPDARFAPDGSEAMIVVRHTKPDGLLRIDLARAGTLPLPAVDYDFVVTASYDQSGQPLVVYADRPRLEQIEDAGHTYLVLDGERFAIRPEAEATGQLRNVVASVWRFELGAWRLLERRAIAQRHPNSLGGLESATLLAPQGAEVDLRHDAIELERPDREWCRTWGSDNEYLSWYRSERGSRPVQFRAYRETRWLATPIVVQADAGWTGLDAWAKFPYTSGHLAGEIAGDYLLLTDNDVTRLHDLRSGAVVWEPPRKTRAAIWPASAFSPP